MIGLIALGLILAFALIKGPTIKSGSFGRNNGFGYEVPPDAETEASGQSPKGRLAHERAEFRLAWLVGLIPAVPVAICLDGLLSLSAVLVAALAQTIGRLLTNSYDYIGHNVEIMIAESEGREGYRAQEINLMADGEQRGMTPEQIDAKLRKWEWLAKVFA